MEVFLVRHTSVAVDKNSCYGQTDVALADTFEHEAQAIKIKLPTDFDAVFSSPLSRCTKLAEAISNQEIVLSPALLEMNFGDWENQLWNDIDQTKLQYWMDNFVTATTPNGESLTLLYQRVVEFIEALRQEQHQKVLICAHAGVTRCVLAHLLQIPLGNIFKINIPYGNISHLCLNENSALDVVKSMH